MTNPRALSVAALALLLVSASPSASTSARREPLRALARPAHVVVIMLENKEYRQVLGSRKAPFFNSFARHNVLLTHELAVTHPSEPNYLAVTSGRAFSAPNDCAECTFRAFNIADQLEHHDMRWKAYMQGLPSPCFMGERAGTFPHWYSSEHDPFIHYVDIRSSPSRCRHIVGFAQLRSDLGRSRLPRFAFISPDDCNDMHSCSLSTGDAWLRAWIPKILGKLGPNGILILTFDEGTTRRGCCGPKIHGGHVPTVIAGPGAANGVRVVRRVDHYSLLRLIEDSLGLLRLGHAADARTPTIPNWRH